MTDPDHHDPLRQSPQVARHPLLDTLSKPRNLMMLGGAVAVLVLAAGTYAIASRGSKPVTPSTGSGLTVAVVAPVEPEVQPGDRMEVGALTDDFDGKMPAPPVDPDRDAYLDQPAYVETGWGSDTSWRRNDPPPASYNQSSYGEPIPPPPREPPPQYRDQGYREDPRAFGFDRPQPNYRAERDARRAALEARIDAERRNPRRVYSSNGPSSDPESEFY